MQRVQTNPVTAAAGKTLGIANSLVNGTTTWKATAQRPVIVVVAVVVVEEAAVVVVVEVVVVGEVVESAMVSKRKSFIVKLSSILRTLRTRVQYNTIQYSLFNEGDVITQ